MSYRRYTKEFKQKILRELETGEETVAAMARRYAVGRSLIYEWQQKQQDGTLHNTFPDREGHLRRQIRDLRPSRLKIGSLRAVSRCYWVCWFSSVFQVCSWCAEALCYGISELTAVRWLISIAMLSGAGRCRFGTH